MDFRTILMLSARGSGAVYSAEATALFGRMTVQPDATRKGLIDTAVSNLVSAGIWAKLVGLWLTAAHDAQAARLNWLSTSFNLSTANAPTFTVDRGYAGDGSTSYLDTSLAPSTAGTLSLNSASMGCWLNAGTDVAANKIVMGCRDATNLFRLYPWMTSPANVMFGGVNSAETSYGAATTTYGFSALSRTASNVTIGYRNATASSTAATVSGTVPNTAALLGGYRGNTGTAFPTMNSRFAMAFIGAGLTSSEMLTLYNTINTYLTAIGAQ